MILGVEKTYQELEMGVIVGEVLKALREVMVVVRVTGIDQLLLIIRQKMNAMNQEMLNMIGGET